MRSEFRTTHFNRTERQREVEKIGRMCGGRRKREQREGERTSERKTKRERGERERERGLLEVSIDFRGRERNVRLG